MVGGVVSGAALTVTVSVAVAVPVRPSSMV